VATEGTWVLVGTGSADSSSNLSTPLAEALTLGPLTVGMSKSSSCGALLSKGTFGVSESSKLGVSPGNEEGKEGRNILHVAPLRLLVEVVEESLPLNAIDRHHLTLLELLKEHLDVVRLSGVHELVVRGDFIPLVGDIVCPLFKRVHRCGAGNAWERLELFFEDLFDIHGRLIVSGYITVMESLEKFRPNAVWITVSILESRVIVFCGGCVIGCHCRTEVLKGLKKQVVKEGLVLPVQVPARCCRRGWTVGVESLFFGAVQRGPGTSEPLVAN
jgi:hypothetical protein